MGAGEVALTVSLAVLAEVVVGGCVDGGGGSVAVLLAGLGQEALADPCICQGSVPVRVILV